MATQVQWRRGTSVQVAAFIGAVGEIVVDTTTWEMSVNDGVTLGGHYSGLKVNGTYTNPTVAGGTFASPTLTGTPVAPTPTLTDNSTKIATTAFVRQYVQAAAPINLPLGQSIAGLVFNAPGF